MEVEGELPLNKVGGVQFTYFLLGGWIFDKNMTTIPHNIKWLMSKVISMIASI